MPKRKAAAAKTFPKEQVEEGLPDRFIPPDRRDQLEADPEDRPGVVDLGANIEILDAPAREDAGADEGGDDGEEEEQQTRQVARESRESRQDDESDEGDDRYSRKVRARINRERALRQQADLRVQNAERRAREVEDRLAKIERQQTDIAENVNVKTLEQKIASLEGQVKAAIAEENTARAFELQVELGDAKADLKLLKRDLEAAKKDLDAEEARRKAERDAAPTATTGQSPTVLDWKHANRGWFGRERYKDARSDAVSIDNEILKEIEAGELAFEKYSDEHLAVLNERLADLYPDLPLMNLDGTEYGDDGGGDDRGAKPQGNGMNRDRGGESRRNAGSNGKRAPMGTGGRRSGRNEPSEADLARQGKVHLREEDFGQMRLYGLDPKNAEHKKRFAKERMRSILTEDRRGARS